MENPLWGARRIHGELLKLGFEIAQSSVGKYMVKRRGPPSQGWRTFLRNHAPDIAAMVADHVKAVLHAALDRFGDHLRRIDVHLSDEIGNKIGHDDKCCMIEARRDGREPIVVTHRETTMDQAIHGAVHSLKNSIESAFGKESGSAHSRNRR
jgi:hypothetical protein